MKIDENNFNFSAGSYFEAMDRRRNMRKNGRFKIMIFMLFSLAMITVGCAAGGGGIVGTSPKLDANLEEAWQYVRSGDNSNAILSFRSVLEKSPNKSEETSAHTGIAWAYSQLNDTEKAVAYFEKVKGTSNDANVGYAGILLSRGKEGDYKMAVQLLEAIHMNNPEAQYASEYRIDISQAQVHALMGIAYYYTGNNKSAKTHIEKAQSTDITDGESPVAKIASAILKDLKLEGY